MKAKLSKEDILMLAKKKGIKISYLNELIGGYRGKLTDWKNGKTTLNEDELKVITDYLLGKSNNSNISNNGNNINQQYIGGNATATIENETKQSADSISEKFMEIFNNLPFKDQLEIMNIAVEKSKKHKEEMT